MNLLLDTHIWIWIYLEPWKVTSEVNQAFADPHNELWLSPFSVWELILLLERRRIRLNEDMGKWVERSRRDLALRDAPFTAAVAHELRLTLLNHRDPGDRFLVATAKAYGLTLVTADEKLLNAPGLTVLANQ